MIDTSQAQSPGWWLERLLCQLSAKQAHYERLNEWSRGRPPLPNVPPQWRAALHDVIRKCRANWAGMIVDAALERMQVVGFRTGGDSTDQADNDAWRVWQANHLDADQELVYRAMLSMGDAHVIVGDVRESTGEPLITPEDPRQVIAESHPMNRRDVIASLKVFADDVEDSERAYLYIDGKVYRASRARKGSKYRTGLNRDRDRLRLNANAWDWFPDDVDEGGMPVGQATPTTRNPVVRFANREDMFGCSLGEFEDVIDELERINLMILQRVQIAIMQAFRQRGLIGHLPTHDEHGNEIDYKQVFACDPAALWQIPDGITMWESAPVDLTPILESVKADIRDLAAQTRTPMYYLFPDSATGSAEGASLQREGLIFKVNRRIAATTEPWERVMSLAFEAKGDSVRADVVDMEAIWQSPERISTTEKYDAASKASAAGVPWRTIMTEILQFSPQQVARMERERMADVAADPMAMVLGELDRGRASMTAADSGGA